MFAHRNRSCYRGIRGGTLLATLGLIMFPAAKPGMAQTAPIALGSLNNPPASAGVLFPTTPVGSTSAVMTLPLQINVAGTSISGVSAAASQGKYQEYSVTSVDCALHTALSAGTTCNVKVTFTPAYPGWRSVPLQVATSAGTFNFGMTGLGTGPQVALTPSAILTIAGNGGPGYSGDGGTATNATVYAPAGMAYDAAGNLYFADFLNNVVRKIAAGTGIVTTVAGNGAPGFSGDHGPAIAAEMNGPYGVALDSAGNLYIADSQNCFIRKVIAATGIITTVVGIGNVPIVMGVPTVPQGYFGDGYAATDARMSLPDGVAVDHAGNIYIADTGNNVIREVNASTDIITTVVGNHKQGYSGDNGPAVSAELNSPISVAADAGGNIFIVDAGNNRVRELATETGIITTVAGNGTAGYSGDGGPATTAELNSPASISIDSAGDLYIADLANNRIRKVNASSSIINTVAGNGSVGFSGDGGPATSATMHAPFGVAVDNAGDLDIVDAYNYRIREVNVLASELNFTTTPVGFTSLDSPQTAMVSNIGNSSLIFSVPASGLNPSVTSGFQLGNSGTCQPLDITSSESTLGSGGSCTLMISFVPVASGPINGSVNIADNALGLEPLVQTIQLNAVGLPAGAAIPDFSISVSPSNQSVGYGATATYAVSVTGIYNFSGPVTLTATGLPPGAKLTINSGTVMVSGSAPATATLTIVTATNQAKLGGMQLREDSAIRFGFLLFPLPLLATLQLRKRLKAVAVLAMLSLGTLTAGLTGCADIGLESKPQSYNVVVTGTSGNLQRTANLGLTVQTYATIKY